MLLSLTVFMLLVAEIMPATSDSVPLIGGLCVCALVSTCNIFKSGVTLTRLRREVIVADRNVLTEALYLTRAIPDTASLLVCVYLL